MIVNVTTEVQANYHLQKGEYLMFDTEDGFGFFKEINENDELYERHRNIADKNNVILIIQPQGKGFIETVVDEKSSHEETIDGLIREGYKMYVVPGSGIDIENSEADKGKRGIVGKIRKILK